MNINNTIRKRNVVNYEINKSKIIEVNNKINKIENELLCARLETILCNLLFVPFATFSAMHHASGNAPTFQNFTFANGLTGALLKIDSQVRKFVVGETNEEFISRKENELLSLENLIRSTHLTDVSHPQSSKME